MLFLIILTVLISNNCAKLYSSNYFEEENGLHSKSRELVGVQVEFVNRGDPLWVLNLHGDDWMAPKLRLGDSEELENFFYYVAPAIRNSRLLRNPARVKKDNPERTTPLQKPIDVKKDFMQMLNKFALTTSLAPDAIITDNTHDYDGSPSLAVHFKGPYTVLIVQLGIKQWHYLINLSYGLPDWFYEQHDTRESPIPVPEDVRDQLFSSLFRLLKVLFGFPVHK